jgi:hypothetical protein
MFERTRVALSRWFSILAAVSYLAIPSGLVAQSATPVPTPAEAIKTKVKIVEVYKDGTSIKVDPVRVKLKRKTDIVIWVTNGMALKVEMKKGNPAPGNPFTDLVCKGRFCAALTPPDVAPSVFRYKVTVDGVVLDPDVEVVP